MSQKIKYNNVIQSFDTSQYIQSDCAEITFINNGTTDVLLNGSLTLMPDESIAFDGKQNEEDVTRYNIVFSPVTGILFNRCVVIRKFYNS